MLFRLFQIILIFRPEDVFWDRNAAQLNSSDGRLHALNLDLFGQRGALMCHIWGGSSITLVGRSDDEVIAEVMDIFVGMYQLPPDQQPTPVFTHVTRWSEDPFALGAYTAGEPSCCGDEDRHAYAQSLPTNVSNVWFLIFQRSHWRVQMQRCTFNCGHLVVISILDSGLSIVYCCTLRCYEFVGGLR